jgi:hypothetical protein
VRAVRSCTRVRVLRLYRRQNHYSSLAFLRELTAAFPFQIRKIQVDNGTDVRSSSRSPARNLDEEEFRGATLGRDFDMATSDIAAWEYRYNHERFSMALHGRTPMEKLAATMAPSPVTARSLDSIQGASTPPHLPRRARAANG